MSLEMVVGQHVEQKEGEMRSVFNAWKKFDELTLTIKTLWAVIALLVFINLILMFLWNNQKDSIRMYIPPDLSQGVYVKPGEANKSNVYSFGFQIFSAINTWNKSGEENYRKNISLYRNYLSSSFYQKLMNDFDSRSSNGELMRIRIMGTDPSEPFNSDFVHYVGNGSWHIDLHVEIEETVNGTVVKHVLMCYPLIIQQVNTSIQNNPWGFVISGYYSTPYRVKTLEKEAK